MVAKHFKSSFHRAPGLSEVNRVLIKNKKGLNSHISLGYPEITEVKRFSLLQTLKCQREANQPSRAQNLKRHFFLGHHKHRVATCVKLRVTASLNFAPILLLPSPTPGPANVYCE